MIKAGELSKKNKKDLMDDIDDDFEGDWGSVEKQDVYEIADAGGYE